MAASATLAGFPPVVYVHFFQGSTEKPGECIVDCMVSGPLDVTALPRTTTLNMYARNFVGQWSDMKVVKAARVRRGYMRVVLHDSRWRMKESTLKENYNERSSLGVVMSGMKKTITELATIIGTASGITINVGSLPLFEPPARWAGLTAAEAMKDLLRITGTRLVYNPISLDYTLSLCGTGTAPDKSAGIFRPGPPPKIKNLHVRSAPILFEDTIECTAKQIDTSTGETATIGNNLPQTRTETYGQTRFRLWEPDSITHPEAHAMSEVLLLDHRAKTHLFDPRMPMHERARIKRDEWEPYPHHQPLYVPKEKEVRLIELTGGGRAFLTDHPVLMTSDGTLSKECEVITSYYIKDATENDGGLRRTTKTVTFGGSQTDELTITVPWLKPVNSTLPDMAGSVWDALHTTVANAIAHRYNVQGHDATTLRRAAPINLYGSGHVGGVGYEFSNQGNWKTRLYMQAALNFTPANASAIR